MRRLGTALRQKVDAYAGAVSSKETNCKTRFYNYLPDRTEIMA
jgi:hypothetical protein